MVLNVRPIIRDLAGDFLYSIGLTKSSRRRKQHPFSIVTFHRVLPEEQLKEYPVGGLAVTPQELQWFVGLFKRDYDCHTLSHNYARWRSGETTDRPLLSITFDDGQLDNYHHARPILNDAGILATFFAVTDGVESNETLWYDRIAYAITKLSSDKPQALQTRLSEMGLTLGGTSHEIAVAIVERAKSFSKDERLDWAHQLEEEAGGATRPAWDGMMNWAQLQQLIQDGHEIGCHTKTHPILPLCNDSELEDEIVFSRQLLEKNLGVAINSFCYPNGDSDARIIKLLKDTGYELAVTTQWGQNKLDASPFTLKRFDMQGQTSRSRNGTLSASRLAWRLSTLFPKRM